MSAENLSVQTPITKKEKARLDIICERESISASAGRKILCKRFSTKSRMALESRADSGMNPLNTESHGGQNGMRAVSA